jgi:glycosyltransferase 2 family protein
MPGITFDRPKAAGLVHRLLHSFWTRLLAACGLIAVVAEHLDLEKVCTLVKGFDKSAGLCMLSVNVLLILAFAKRWQLIASGLEFRPPYAQLVRTIWLAGFLGQFGPTLLIAEATRFQMLRKHATAAQLILSQLLDRISGQFVLLLIVLLLLPLYLVQQQAGALEWLLVIAGIILLAVLTIRLLSPRIRKWPHRRARQAMELLGAKGLPGHYGLSLIIQLLLVLNFTLAAAGLGIRDQIGSLAVLAPLLFAAITLLPVSIADWGTREAAAAMLLSPTGLDLETIVSISVLYGLFHLLAVLPGGLFLLYRPHRET